MPIIDKQGRIFGRLNIIDFTVVVFLLCLTPIFWYGYKIMNHPKTPINPPVLNRPITDFELEKIKKIDKFLSEHKKMRKYFE